MVCNTLRERANSFYLNLLSDKLDSMDGNCCSSNYDMMLSMNQQPQVSPISFILSITNFHLFTHKTIIYNCNIPCFWRTLRIAAKLFLLAGQFSSTLKSFMTNFKSLSNIRYPCMFYKDAIYLLFIKFMLSK